MRYLSVCSGIEAASVAWHHLGWQPVGFSEIEPFPSAVLAHRFPNIPNFGDMTRHGEWNLGPGSIDLLVGGTPCQSFSVAGLRKGLSDPRGGLMLTYLEIAQRLRPRWIVWENVPGVLSSGSGRDLGAFLGALGELGYWWAYRVLDAQWVRVDRWPKAVPQRRRRLFVVGCLGDPTAAAQVLFERESVCRDSAPRRAAREGVAADAEAGVARCITTGEMKRQDYETCTMIAQPTAGTLGTRGLRSHTELDGHGAYIPVAIQAGATRENPASGPDGIGVRTDGVAYTIEARAEVQAVGQPVAFTQNCREEVRDLGDESSALTGQGTHQQTYIAQPVPFTKAKRAQSTSDDETWVDGQVNPTLSLFDQGDTRATTVAVAFHPTQDPISSTDGSTHCMGTGGSRGDATIAVAHTLRGEGFDASEDGTERGTPLVPQAMTVRRLTPRECERLQGFPDDWTMIPYRGKPPEQCPDGPRYKALGNSMACNAMAWIGERIAAYENQNP